jgi:hypothetical protein
MPLQWIGGEDRGPPKLEFDPKSLTDNELWLDSAEWRIFQGIGSGDFHGAHGHD